MILNNQQIMEEIKKEIKICIETNENMTTQTYGTQWSGTKREAHSNTGLPQETRETPNNSTVHLKQLGKEQKNPRVSRRKEIIKIRAEIIEKEMKETIAKINKIKTWFVEKITKIHKLLARFIKNKRENNQ